MRISLMWNLGACLTIGVGACGAQAFAAENAAEPTTRAVTAPVAVGQPAGPYEQARQVVRDLFAAVADRVAANRAETAPMRVSLAEAAEARLAAVAARDAILARTPGLQGRADLVIRSWPRILAHYVGRWNVDKALIQGAGGEQAVAIVPVAPDASGGLVLIEVRLAKRPDQTWGVSWVGFQTRAIRRAAGAATRGAATRVPSPAAEGAR